MPDASVTAPPDDVEEATAPPGSSPPRLAVRTYVFLQRLVGARRSQVANRRLGGVLAFIAGAINAGGFLAVNRYTSHISGVVSSIADDLAIGSVILAGAGVVSLASFIAGAACTAILINWGRRRHLRSVYALPLMLEAALLLLFGIAGAGLKSFAHLLVPSTVLLLFFMMGLQNAIITKMSGAEIRTTHMTGIATDLGIELGKLFYWNGNDSPLDARYVRANRDRLKIHATILSLFLVGGLAGALAFKSLGYASTIPIALVLIVLALPSTLSDFEWH
jgi:uncharacterized membrane protein YoaK (UPF0700 family)